MTQSTNQSIIETTVNSAIKRIQNDPERSIRNLVDMALMFCNGRFQKRFFEVAQKMLENEDSSYYRLIPDVIANVESARITSFGINVGYHSCTRGARTIRKIKTEQNLDIPWCITLKIDSQNEDASISFVEEKQAQGVYTWFVNAKHDILSVLDIAKKFPNSAFIIICDPEDITDIVLDEFSEIYNIMFAVNYDDGIDNTCALLRKRRFLFSVVYTYGAQEIDSILNDSILAELSSLHGVFSFFLSNRSSSPAQEKEIFEHIQNTRYEQEFQTISIDLIYDIKYINNIISLVPRD